MRRRRRRIGHWYYCCLLIPRPCLRVYVRHELRRTAEGAVTSAASHGGVTGVSACAIRSSMAATGDICGVALVLCVLLCRATCVGSA